MNVFAPGESLAGHHVECIAEEMPCGNTHGRPVGQGRFEWNAEHVLRCAGVGRRSIADLSIPIVAEGPYMAGGVRGQCEWTFAIDPQNIGIQLFPRPWHNNIVECVPSRINLQHIICNCVKDFDVTPLRSISVTILLERRAVLGSKRVYD